MEDYKIMTVERTYILEAQTDLWTGDASGRPGRLIHTGLLGSIRWWFEVLVRGLGGSACDPSQTQCQGRNHCVACELFGCTGWARKFRFDVLETGSGRSIQRQIKKDTNFLFRFTALRPVRDEEWALLDLTLRLIADYGAIGGKTVLKPSDEPSWMHKPHHRDYGLVAIVQPRELSPLSLDRLRTYVCSHQWRSVDDSGVRWASIANFWFVNGRYLARQDAARSTFDEVLGREEPKRQAKQLQAGGDVNSWLAGGPGTSKKVFSFKHPARTFGFVKPGVITFEEMRCRLKAAWRDLADGEFLEGPAILSSFRRATGVPRQENADEL